MILPQLKRVRWGVRATLTLGVTASVIANVLHARDNLISQVIAAWPPLALLLTVELISRVPVHRRWLAAVRLAATAGIALIAAWVSYWHMAGVVARYGETGATPYLMPMSVDGLVVVASICLVELAGRIRAAETPVAAPLEVAVPETEETAADQPEQPEPDTADEAPPKPTPATATVARARRRDPALTQQQIATKTGLSLTTVKRQWPLTAPEDPAPVNGRHPQLTTT